MKPGDLVRWHPPSWEVGTEDPDAGLIGIIVEIEQVSGPFRGMFVVLWSDGTTGRGLHPDHLTKIDYHERG